MEEGREGGGGGGGKPSQSFGYLNHQCYMDIAGRGFRMGIPIPQQVKGS